MVIQSTINYKQWKEEVKDKYNSMFPQHKDKVQEFIDYVSSVYDPCKRSFIPPKLIWYLYWRRKQIIDKKQHFWMAIIGKKGGEGKSTALKHFLYFCDKTFHTDTRTAMDYDSFIKIVYQSKKIDKIEIPAILMDEVDPSVHQMSKKGGKLRQIITKIRQLNLIVGVAANSLSDVPMFIYDRLTCIMYIDENHRFYLWDVLKDKPKHSIISDIKNGWKDKKHGIFNDIKIKNRSYFKNMEVSAKLPFKEKSYDLIKDKDLTKNIEDYLGIGIKKKEQITKKDVILKLKQSNPDLKNADIARLTKSHPVTVSNALNC